MFTMDVMGAAVMRGNRSESSSDVLTPFAMLCDSSPFGA